MTQMHQARAQETNWLLVGTLIAAVVIGLAALLYARDTAARLAGQQEIIGQLQATLDSQQALLTQANSSIEALRTSLDGQASQLHAATKELQALKEAERKRIEKAKAAAKAKPKAQPKAVVKKKKTN